MYRQQFAQAFCAKNLEDPADLLEDLDQALSRAVKM
jgi:hypothetical protein